MPLFMSDLEFQRCSGDAGLVAEKADAFIRVLVGRIETAKAAAVAAAKTQENNCSFLREKEQLLLRLNEKDGEIERLKREASEVQESKRQKIEQNVMVNMTENAASKDAHLSELESELGRMQATSARLLQEKELLEAEMSSKLTEVEKKFKESSSSLVTLYKGIVRELEEKLASMETELLSTRRFSAEISTATKLADLYKESSEEWSGEPVGVIEALESRLDQVESEYKYKLEKEVSARMKVEKDSADLKEKLQKIAELVNLENSLEDLKRKNLLPSSSE